MSQPAFAPERREIWYSDGTSGFHVLRMTNDTWPSAASAVAEAKRCGGRRYFTIRLKQPRGDRLRSARVTVDGKRVRVRRGATRLTARIDLRRKEKKTVVVRVVGRTRSGKVVRDTRRYRTCTPRTAAS